VKSILKKLQDFYVSIPQKTKLLIFIIAGLLILALIAVLIFSFVWRRSNHSEIITITYANWNLGEHRDNALELRMIQSFMDEHPNIRVEIDQSVAHPWTESLSIAASQNRLPDVFMLEDISVKAANGWLRNITSYVWDDSDFFDLTPSVREAMRMGSFIYAVPFAQNIHGYFVNLDLLRELGVEPPSFGMSASSFVEAVRAASDLSSNYVGLNQVFSIIEWYPSAVNSNLGFFAFDGFSFALNSPEMLEAVRIAAELYGYGSTYYGVPVDTRIYHFPSGYAIGAFRDGQMAFLYGDSGLAEILIGHVPFEWAFIGVPGGRSIVTLEALGISSTTSHPEEAYLLARWMGHGVEGNLRRLEYSREMGLMPNNLPVTQNRAVLEELWQILPVPGIVEVYASMDRALINGLRVMPGYMQARFTAPTGVNVYGSALSDIGVESLIRYSITGYAYFPYHSQTAEEVARYQLDAALAAFR